MQMQSSKESTLARIRSISHILDNAIAIPGTNYRVGIDPLIGLLPGGGDMLSAGLSVYIVWEAARLGLPRSTVSRMVSNLVLDALLGTLPFLGDLFDATWKANTKNIALLEAHLATPQTQKKADKGFVLLLLFGFLLLAIALTTITALILGFIWQLIFR
jgi:hypothetical protein